MAKHIHINSDVRILTDEAARQALELENDREFLTDTQGVVRVTEERWRRAQTTERRHWMHLGLGSDNDRNYEHFVSFGGYRVLHGRTFESAIELGCGPFTNLRLIADVCRVKRCTLLDPLAESYLTHPNRAYTESALFLENTRTPMLLRRVQRKLLRRFPRLRSLVRRRSLPVDRLLPLPIEQMPTVPAFDLLAIINVIEHCYDVEAVLEKIRAALKPGGVLVFHEPLYDHTVVSDLVTTVYDAAHPLQVDRSVLLAFLADYFMPLYEHQSFHTNIFEGEDLSFKGIYFIGVRK